ncbi:MAG: SulP family inorganic anion transporter [Gammaproteobacteria bacterium]|nr:SulP family inorganic anion transporter [Gammaproteobacteria bacterium]
MNFIFNDINLKNVRGDAFGGVTAAVIALPMALAFGVASGAGAEAGLYGAIMVGLFAALFGGSSTLISEPTGPMTVVFTAVLATLIGSNPDNGMAMAFTVVIMAGCFQILFGFLRLGKFVTLMPYTVISGFMSGIGIILVILQIGPLLGQAPPPGGVLAILNNIPELISGIRYEELAFGVLTMAILFLFPSKLQRYVPPQLVALIVCTLLSLILFNMDGMRRIGEIPTGFPELQMPVFSTGEWQVMLINGLVLGLLGCIDALLTSVIADSLTGKHHNSNKELVGQGIGNIMSGLFGGLPGAGATMGTVVNIQAGARTALSGLVRAGILVIVILWATDLTAVIPLVVLSGIAFKVGVDIVDWNFLRRVHLVSAKGAAITYGVICLTVFVDLIAAVGIGLFVANVLTITRLAELQADDVKAVTDSESSGIDLSDEEAQQLDKSKGAILLLHLTGMMNFGASKEITKKILVNNNCKLLMIDLKDVVHLGISSALALETGMIEAIEAGHNVVVTGKNDQPMQRLRQLGALNHIADENVIVNRQAAMQFANNMIKA